MFVAIAFFLFMSFFLSGSETALTAINKTKVKSRAENGDQKSKKLLNLISQPDKLITSILIGNNVSNIMLPTLVTIIAIEYGWNVGVATGVLTVVLIVFAEVLPKSVAATFPGKVSYLVYPVIRGLVWLVKPLTFFLSRFTRAVIRLLSSKNPDDVSVSKEELMTMVDIAAQEGTFHNEEQQRIRGVIEFNKLDIRDALKVPRMEIEGIPEDATYEEARDIAVNGNHTRYPVYRENMDNIVGVFHTKLLLSWSLEPEQPLKQFTDNEPLFVFEFHSIEKVFKRMLQERKHLAIVLDEYGGTSGIITTEDIIEVMIGQEIKDETDENEEVLIEELTDSHIICNGKISLHRLNEVFKTRIPEEEDILAGFLLRELGHLPEEGETYNYQHLHFTVKKVEDNQIKMIEIQKRMEVARQEENDE